MVIKNFRHSMLNYYYLIGQLVVPLGSTFYFPPMLNYFNLAEFGLRAALYNNTGVILADRFGRNSTLFILGPN